MMSHASVVVPHPMAQVKQVLLDPTSWPRFLPALTAVDQLAAGRFRCTLTDGRRAEQVVVATSTVRSTITWQAEAGPVYAGTLHLEEVDAQRTCVHLTLEVGPRGRLAGLTGRFAGRARHADDAVAVVGPALDDLFATLPPPPLPRRLRGPRPLPVPGVPSSV